MKRTLVVVAACLLVTACDGDDQNAAPPTQREQADAPASSPDSSRPVPAAQADGCPVFDPELFEAVEAELADGLRLGTATSGGSEGVTWLVANVHRASNGERLASAVSWALVDGRTVAVSSSAGELSRAPDGADVVPDAFSDAARQELEDCVFEAILAR